MVRWRDSDSTMLRWRWRDRASRHRVIVIAPSRYRHRVIASSHHIAPSLHRALAPSRHRHRAIAPSHHRHTSRWYDGAIVKCMALSGFHTKCIDKILYKGHLRNECLFFSVHGIWIAVRNKQIAWTAKRFSCDLFVPHCDSYPMNREKKTLIPYLQCLQQRPLLKFSEQSKKFKFPAEIGHLTLFPDRTIIAYSFRQNSAWINGEKVVCCECFHTLKQY